MNSNELKIPKLITLLVENGVWPKTREQLSEKLKAFTPDEYYIHFYYPPFITVEEELTTNKNYWEQHGALEQIDPKLSLIIADFGIGSDTCLILDYRESLTEPSVWKLVWAEKNYWKKIANTFEEFALISGLNNLESID